MSTPDVCAVDLPDIRSAAAHWRARIAAMAPERCDLNLLLRDEWRHRATIRDDRHAPHATRQQQFVVDGDDYAALQKLLCDNTSVSLSAVVLLVLHSVLDAYGYGSKTVAALTSVTGVLPVIVDHEDQAELTAMSAIESLERELSQKDAWLPLADLFGHGLLDAALVLADRDLTSGDLPAAPLVTVVRDLEGDECLQWTMWYPEELFDDTVIIGVLDVAREVLRQLVHNPAQRVREIELVSAEQKIRFGQPDVTEDELSQTKRLNQLFEAAAQRSPEHEAVVFGDSRLTYRELNERSNQLAHWLIGPAANVRPGELIAMYLDKSDLGVIVTLGVWKAGAAYVPIDPSYPADRIRFTVRDTRASAIITNRRYAAQLRETLGELFTRDRVIEIETLFGPNGDAGKLPTDNPDLVLGSGDLAYVTYTSGTTGVPKGVPKDHASVVNSITDLSERYDMRGAGTERVALFASYVFEPHLRQTLIALINSQTLIVVPEDIRLDPDLFPDFIAQHGVTYLNATGSVLQHFDLRRCAGLKRILLVGEELTPAGLRQLREQFDGRIINEYAFTEAAFVTAVKEFAPGVADRTDRSIGRPLRNVTWYVLSQRLRQLPIGAVGELYIGGCGVAPGYLNRDDLTAERFFANPFQSEADRARGHNGRIYRTGDLARILPNGEVEYLGRSDFQLKLSGIRIEPGEIEAQAMEFPGVQKCVVIARAGTGDSLNRHLVGYFVADPSAEVTEAALLAFLEQRLIRIMVPARMIRLAKLPVNVNGKVDRRALPDVSAIETGQGSGEAGHGDVLRGIWSSVLGVPASRIEDTDDFFRLGGQSISCILLIARVRRQLRRSLSVEDVFRLRTLRELAHHLQRQEVQTGDRESPAPSDADDALPLRLPANGLQQGLLYHSLKSSGDDDAYVMQSVYRYHCPISTDSMQLAWEHAHRKYPGLRTSFEWEDEPLQVIGGDDKPFDWRFIDISGLPDIAEQEAQIRSLQMGDRDEPYKLSDGRLFRVYLIKQTENLYALLLSCHHIIMDGWSLPVLHDEVHRTYLSLTRGVAIEATMDTAYIAAQRHWQAHRGDHIGYWTEQIAGVDERCDLAGLLNERSRYQTTLRDYDHVLEHKTKKLSLGGELTSALKAACAANQITLHSVVQFAWHKVLHAIGGGRTTVVGTIVSGRGIPVEGVESSVGLFINTLPLIVNHDDQAGLDVVTAIGEIQTAVNAMNSKSTVDLGRLPSGEMKRQLFDTLLVLENYPQLMDEREEQQHLDLLPFEKAYDIDKVDYPIAVVAREEVDELTISLWYAGELFDDYAIDTLLDVTHTLLRQVAEDVFRPVRDIELVSSDAVTQFEAWNATAADFPDDRTLHQIFEEAAARWPDETAVVYRDTTLSYRELNERANHLAHHLSSVTALRPNELIALVMDKSEAMITAIVAVWKTGAAYVPIDPGYPDDRIAFMLEDTQARLILTGQAHQARLETLTSRPVFVVEHLPLDGSIRENPVTGVESTDLAYAIYTSGTTGTPKAVLIEHRGVVNLQISLARLFSLSKSVADEALLSFSNYVFDHFVEQMTDALLNGQKLVVLDDELRTDEARLCKYINDNGVTYLSGTPSVLSLYDFSAATTLTRIDAIGEDFTEPVFNKIRGTFKGTIINGYGPTEISITSHKRLYGTDEERLNKSIGYPVANTKCYVLDSTLKRVPVGGIGELYIGGIGVARGYLNRAELTAERFLSNPFQSVDEERAGANARLYKTGDLVRWLPNGELEYLGRTDLQVKIRGQRVELGEIEAVLSAHPDVSRSLVVAREHPTSASQKYLAGFYLSDRDIPEEDLKHWMRRKLPEAIVPARILRIDGIPVTASGKLDPRRLPETDFAQGNEVTYTAPATDVEVKLCGIWSKVLNIAPNLIGMQDDFLALGGDSLSAMTLVQSITSAFGYGFGVAAVLTHTTLAAQVRHIETTAALPEQAKAGSAAGLAAGHHGHPPVSLAQQRLLFIDDFEGGTASYNIPFYFRIATNAVQTRATIADALRTLVRRHPALRTLVREDSEGIRRQHVLTEDIALPLFHIGQNDARDMAELDEMLAKSANHLFQLHEELPIRAELIAAPADPNMVILGVVAHHTCFDGWSLNIFCRELAALISGVPETQFVAPRGSYADYTIWQWQYLTGRRLSTLTGHWAAALAGFEPVALPLDHPRPPRFDYRGREFHFGLDKQTTDQLRAMAQSARVSLYSVLLSAWCLMLNSYTGQRDLVVGTPAANRGRPEFGDVIGLFANLLVLRVRVDSAAMLMDYVRSVGAAVVVAQTHGELPFEQLVKELEVEQDPSRHPVVQVNFTLQSPVDEHAALTGYKPDEGGWTTAKFDLSATLTETSDGLSGNLTYAASLFDDATANGFVATFRHILAEYARLSADQARLADISYVDAADRDTLLIAARSEPAAQAPAGMTLPEMFQEVVAAWPDETAVVCGDTAVSYRELNERANQLAHHLNSIAELQPSDLVALVLDKNEAMLTAIIAVWKSGAAYVPIDPGYPDDRLRFMLEDTQARLVVTGAAHQDRLAALSTPPVLAVERLKLDGQPRENPVTGVKSTDLAYAIYTSGTTGRPKAVLVDHHNVLSFHRDLSARYFGPAPQTRQGVLLLANYVFDFSVEQMMLSILSGHKLLVPPAELALPDTEFYEWANRERLTYLSGTPTQIQQFDLSRLVHLRCLLVAGEAFQEHHFDKIRQEYDGPIFNAYGTTETTVYNTVRRFEPGDPYENSLGEPLGNTRLYILGDSLQLLPTGAIGELYLAGECVSAGYLNQQELTAERFLDDPFRTKSGQVMYKSGDLVRRHPDGEIRYLGRNDAQVKIRGLRIELGEVEVALAACPGVRQCAVIAQSDRLVGYYVAESDAIDEDLICEALRAKLTPSMVPSLIRLDHALPMTINGKLDTHALPRLIVSATRVEYAPPRNRAEARLCDLWGVHLPSGSAGIDEDFFRSGGDSIRALHLASQVQRELNRKVSVKHIFDFPTVRRFADNVLASMPEASDSADDGAEQGRLSGDCPMLPIQEWFFAKPLSNHSHWNQNFAIQTPTLDVAQLRAALDKLAAHHDAFRLRYRADEHLAQFYDDGDPGLVLHTVDIRNLPDDELQRRLTQWQRGFALDGGPTSCAAYLYGYADGSARVWLAMHHLITDVVSWHILARDLEILYHGGDLGRKGSSYRQWAEAVEQYRPEADELELWTEIVQSMVANPPDGLLPVAETRRTGFTLAEAQTHALLTECQWAFDTDINDLLLTAVGLALQPVTHQVKNHITVEGHGREHFAGAPDVRDTVGWFTTMHPMQVEACGDLGDSIRRTRANRRSVPHHGIGYGALRGVYGSARAPLPPVSFNYLGRLTQDDANSPSTQRAGWHLDAGLCGTSTGEESLTANSFSIDVTMSCVQGRLVTTVDSRLGEPSAERFTSDLQARLEELIARTSDNGQKAARRAKPDTDFDPYVLVNEENVGRDLFVLPPGEGGAESYLSNIARHLPGHRLVLFNNVHLHSRHESFESLARYYIQHIRALQPCGPYHLLGWSFGGVIALEIARQLTRADEKIGSIAFIDSYFDVRQASAAIGLPDVEDILDRIDYHYTADRADLERLHELTESVTLFKADRPNDVTRGEEQRRLFEFYQRSRFNSLDSFLPIESIKVELLTGETHHSWVHNQQLVTAMSTRIMSLLAGSPADASEERL